MKAQTQTPHNQDHKNIPSHHNISFKTQLRSQFIIFKQFIDTMIALNKSFKIRFGGSTKQISSLPYFALRDRFLFDFQFNFQDFIKDKLKDFTLALSKAEDYDKNCKDYVEGFKKDVKNVIQIAEKKCGEVLEMNNRTISQNLNSDNSDFFKFEIEQLKEFILEDKKNFERVDSSLLYEIKQPSTNQNLACKETEKENIKNFNKNPFSNKKPVLLTNKKKKREKSTTSKKKFKKISRNKIRRIKSQAPQLIKRDRSQEIINKIISESVFESKIAQPEIIQGSIKILKESRTEQSVDNTEHIKSIYDEKNAKRSPESNTLQYSQISHYRQESEESSKFFNQNDGGSPYSQFNSYIQFKESKTQNLSRFCEYESPNFKSKGLGDVTEESRETYALAKKYIGVDDEKKISIQNSILTEQFRSTSQQVSKVERLKDNGAQELGNSPLRRDLKSVHERINLTSNQLIRTKKKQKELRVESFNCEIEGGPRCMEMISGSSALIYGYNCGVYFVEFDPRTNSSKTNKIRQNGHYLDMVYFEKLKIGYIYDDLTETTFKYNHQTQKFTGVMKGSLSLNQGKLLRKSHNEDLLFIRTGKSEITIVSSLMNSVNFGQVNLFSSKSHSIVDFRSLKNNKIIAVSDLGEISIAEKVKGEEFSFRVIETYNLNLLEDEIVTCINVSKCSKYISVGTKWGRNQLCKLFFLKIYENEPNSIVEKFIVDMRNAEYAENPESYFHEINMDLSLDGDMILLCYQRYGDNLLIPLVFKNKYLEMLSEPFSVHSGLLGKSVSLLKGEDVWSIDATGLIKKINIY